MGYIERKHYILAFGTIECSNEGLLPATTIGRSRKRVDPVRERVRESWTMILNVFATYELGRNELHIALALWLVAKFERIKYLSMPECP